jgi:uncharacterized protein (TIGR00297 family)
VPSNFDWTFSSDFVRALLGALAAFLVAFGAWRLRALTMDGAIAATLLGALIVGAGGWWAGLLLIAFFITSSILSRIGRDRTIITSARGSRRDAVQVAANGGVAAICALGALIGPDAGWLLALTGSLAAANADTWSTEIGRRSATLPRLITTGRRVPAGTSGAISPLGTLGALLGGALLAVIAAIGASAGWLAIDLEGGQVVLAVGLAGLSGSLVDSLIGATVQAQRWCPACAQPTERTVHRCGTPTCHRRGVPWITNDVVNLACITSGAILAAGIGAVLRMFSG